MTTVIIPQRDGSSIVIGEPSSTVIKGANGYVIVPGARPTSPPPPPPATVQPALADRAFQFSADTITPQTDDTVLGSWTDSVAGLTISQATDANKPFYRASRLGAKPAVQFKGLNWFTIGRPTALMNALSHYNDATGVTLFFVMANIAAEDDTFNTFFSPTNVNDARSLRISGGRCGGAGFPGPRLFASMGGIHIIVQRVSTVVCNNDTPQFFHNMNAYCSGDLSPHSSNNYQLGADGTGTDTGWTLHGDMMQFGCYNRALTVPEIAQLVKWACEKYGQPYPWAGADHFDVFDGDSITFGLDAVASTGRNIVQNAWPQLLMDAKARPFGAWTNLAIPSRTSNQMQASAAGNYTGLAAQLGLPIIVLGFEFYNQSDSDAHGMKAFDLAVKTVAHSAITCIGDSTDNGRTAGAGQHDNRAAFNAALATDPNINVFVPLHTDVNVGVEGSCPDDPGPYGPNFDDGTHPVNAGHLAIKNFWSSYYDAAVAML